MSTGMPFYWRNRGEWSFLEMPGVDAAIQWRDRWRWQWRVYHNGQYRMGASWCRWAAQRAANRAVIEIALGEVESD